MKIRKAKIEDVDKIVDIKINGWKDAYKEIIDDSYLKHMSKNREEKIEKIKKQLLENKNFIVVENETEILGFCRYGEIRSREFKEYDSEIYAIYVKPGNLHQGIGRKMFEFATKDLKSKGKSKMILWCLKDNYPSRKFYERMGGNIIGKTSIQIGEKRYEEVCFGYEI